MKSEAEEEREKSTSALRVSPRERKMKKQDYAKIQKINMNRDKQSEKVKECKRKKI